MTTRQELACLILVYKRVTNLEIILAECVRAGIKSFFFAVDGPKNERDVKDQEILLQLIVELCTEFRVAFSISRLNSNRGIFINMFSGLEWFFERNSFGLILEDDTIPSLDFVEFVVRNREKLEKNPTAMLISGWRGTHKSENLYHGIEYCTYPLIWGWATTSNKWRIMRKWFYDENPATIGSSSPPIHTMGFWKTGLRRVVTGRLDSWANVLAFRFLIHGYRSIVPSYSLVENVGYDQFATHSIEKKGLTKSTQISASNLTLDKWLETEVYGISKRHALAPLYGPIFDLFRGRPKRVPPLKLLLNLRKQVEGPIQLRDLL